MCIILSHQFAFDNGLVNQSTVDHTKPMYQKCVGMSNALRNANLYMREKINVIAGFIESEMWDSAYQYCEVCRAMPDKLTYLCASFHTRLLFLLALFLQMVPNFILNQAELRVNHSISPYDITQECIPPPGCFNMTNVS